MQRSFDLNGVSLTVRAEDETLMAPLLPYLEELPAARAATAGFTLEIARGNATPPPSDAELLFEGALPEGPACRLLQCGDTRWLDVPGELCLEVSVSRRTARVALREGSRVFGGSPAVQVIEAALNLARHHLVHAAALRLDPLDVGFMLFARSGAGKTTTALALALSGFGFLTDDATVLMEPQPGAGVSGFRIWGLPRPLNVHKRTVELLPQIAPLIGPEWNAEGEQVLFRRELARVAAICPPRPLPLGAIVMLGARVEGAHVLQPAEKTEIMSALASDNVFRAPLGLKPDQLARFDALAAAVAATPVFHLRVGRDLPALGPLFASTFAAR